MTTRKAVLVAGALSSSERLAKVKPGLPSPASRASVLVLGGAPGRILRSSAAIHGAKRRTPGLRLPSVKLSFPVRG